MCELVTGPNPCDTCGSPYGEHLRWCSHAKAFKADARQKQFEAMRRVWQLLASGYCPMCETFIGVRNTIAELSVLNTGQVPLQLQCEVCGFVITGREIEQIEEQLFIATKTDLAAYTNWRKERAERTG